MTQVVEFKLDLNRLVSTAKSKPGVASISMVAAARELTRIFNFAPGSPWTLVNIPVVRIICLPEQFVAFLIWRRDNGMCNHILDLDITMRPAGKPKEQIPVLVTETLPL